jgi:hypothetical protein
VQSKPWWRVRWSEWEPIRYGRERPSHLRQAGDQEDVQGYQFVAVVILSNVMDSCGSAETEQNAKIDCETIEHRLEYAAHRAFLAPNLAPARLLIPEVTTI